MPVAGRPGYGGGASPADKGHSVTIAGSTTVDASRAPAAAIGTPHPGGRGGDPCHPRGSRSSSTGPAGIRRRPGVGKHARRYADTRSGGGGGFLDLYL